jgi:hypothetical protein
MWVIYLFIYFLALISIFDLKKNISKVKYFFKIRMPYIDRILIIKELIFVIGAIILTIMNLLYIFF